MATRHLPSTASRARMSGHLGMAMLVAACGRSAPEATTILSDSAGVAIVSHTGSDRAGGPSLELDFRLGGDASRPASFYGLYPRYVTVSPSGVIGIVNAGAFQAKTFGPDGAPIGTYGGPGEGPGELRAPSAIAVRADGEVLVHDYTKGSLVRFSRDGEVLEEQRLTVPFNGLGMAATHSGLLVLSDTRTRGNGPVSRRLMHLSPADTVQLGSSVRGSSKVVQYRSCGGVSMSQPPLFSSELVWGSNGDRTAVVTGADYSVQVFDGTKLVLVVRRDVAPEAASSAVAERELGEGERWSVGGRECTVPAPEVIEQRGYASAVPIVEAVSVTPSGGLWILRRNAGTSVRSLDVFDEEGRYVATSTPSPPFPLAFLPDGRLLTLETDSMDVQTLAVYSIGNRAERDTLWAR